MGAFEVIFHSIWTFLGTVVLIAVILEGIKEIFEARRK
jgi:hypothetical protein